MTAARTGLLAGKQVRRLGFGTMRLTGPGIWGPPASEADAVQLLRKAVELGVQHIDTADAYGPNVAEGLIRKALFPYADDLIIATKGGFTRQGPGKWTPCGVPAYLRQCVEMSLRQLNVEAIDLYYLHRVDPNVPLADQVGELEKMRQEGKIKCLGLSKVDILQLTQAIAIAPIAAVQNQFSILDNQSEDVIRWCEQNETAFIPYAPLSAGRYFSTGEVRDQLASATHALKWLLNYSPVMFPIPGTSRVEHLEENLRSDIEG
ncbi:aldo/keto reductase [Pseudomonas sp. 25 R 14]|uniref:aldo/keto reductase n=1 Tax=Pseudomonas sp. 25 R 14 TaxID=1844109 RepID=UPI000811DE77|nr:aldo/keto reductase [Pseudomonas sp. 25 R 14]CRM46809.1 Putative oxidoreductase YdbC [Pseudomonas sp. 25 R 14]